MASLSLGSGFARFRVPGFGFEVGSGALRAKGAGPRAESLEQLLVSFIIRSS